MFTKYLEIHGIHDFDRFILIVAYFNSLVILHVNVENYCENAETGKFFFFLGCNMTQTCVCIRLYMHFIANKQIEALNIKRCSFLLKYSTQTIHYEAG